MPADHGVRLDDDERRSPARPGTREPRPEQAIRPREARSSGRAREHHELLAQGEVLQGDVAPRAYGAAQEAAGEPKVGEQGAASFRTDAVRLARTLSSVNQSDSDEILGPHRGTNAAIQDSDGDGLKDCREAADVDGNSAVNFTGDVIQEAKFELIAGRCK